MINAYKRLLNATFRESQRQNLAEALDPLFPETSATILDIGAGNGEFAALLQKRMPQLHFTGLELLDRGEALIPMTLYDGGRIPFEDKSFDYAMLINMLHHTSDPKALLQEALRISRYGVIIKDHYSNNLLDRAILTAMEYANPNSKALMQLPLSFLSRTNWDALFAELELECDVYDDTFPSYGSGWDWLFGRDMHFIGRYRRMQQ